jgi:hypothetical protein
LKRTFPALIGLFLVTAALHAQNPIIQTIYTADPAPMVYKDTVYLYTGHDEDDAPDKGFKMFDWHCFTSTDMANWTDKGVIASTQANFPWADRNSAWAAQCVARNGKFYLYCPVKQKSNNSMSIGVLVGDSPTGPFTDPLGKPLIANSHEDIDPTVLIDDDGQAYLYWGNPNLYYVKLNKDMISWSGAVTKDTTKPANYQEAPWVYKHNGTYYLAYASTCCPEGIGYCTSDRPFGAWTYRGLIMNGQKASAGNHPGIIDYKGRSWLFGFNAALPGAGNQRRSVCADRFSYAADGSIALHDWSDTGPEQIGTFDPYLMTEATTIAWSRGVRTATNSISGGASITQPNGGAHITQPNDRAYITQLNDGDYIKLRGVDFGKGAKKFDAAVASGAKGGRIEIRLDSLTGPLAGTCKIRNTGGWLQWKTATATIKHARDTHDLYLIFKGEEGDLFNVSNWKFNH